MKYAFKNWILHIKNKYLYPHVMNNDDGDNNKNKSEHLVCARHPSKLPLTGTGSFYPHKIHNEVGKIRVVILRQIKNMIFVIQLAQVSQLGCNGT